MNTRSPLGLLADELHCVAVAISEGLAILFIAMIWRIVSSKYTHIVERLQLLTLIIIGEGIIGMIKSVAYITKGQAKNDSSELGTDYRCSYASST